MAYYSLHSYDADVRIPSFLGVRQDSEIAYDLRFAAEAENVETPDGVLQPQAGMTMLDGEFESRVETIASFHRRWYTGIGSKDFLIAASGGKLYYKQAGGDIDWIQINMPQNFGTFSNNVWSWVTYEVADTDSEQNPITVDVLLISNADDGLFMVKPPERPTKYEELTEYTHNALHLMTHSQIHSEKWQATRVDTRANPTQGLITDGPRFGVIARYNERIWGGAVKGEPDALYYSRPYDPADWTAPGSSEEPEEGAGEIHQPSWDGDSFTVLKNFGDQLIAFKGHRVWRVMGIGPAEYTFVEQYGGGTLYPNTVEVDKERIYLAETDGISAYDGMTVNPFNRGALEQFWKTVNRNAMSQMCSAFFKQKYYLAVPTGNSEVNNAMIVYNTEDGSFLIYTDIFIESMMPSFDTLYVTSSSLPGKVMVMNYNSWDTGFTSGKQAKWTTPWMDFNYKTIAKGGYEIYFNPEVKNAPVTFRFTIQTEKKEKSKIVTIQPTTFKAKQKRIRFGGTSRKFRLTIETLQAASTAVWRLVGGVHMVVETDPD